MRQIEVVVPFAGYEAGAHVDVNDQIATDAIAAGLAVPSIASRKSVDAAPENKAFDGASETV